MNYFILDDLFERMASEGKTHFTPHYICERSGNSDPDRNSILEITQYLLSLCTKGTVVPLFDVECPGGDSDFTVSDPSLITEEPRYCSYCGMEYTPNPNRIWVSFNFTDEYKNHVKKKRGTCRTEPTPGPYSAEPLRSWSQHKSCGHPAIIRTW